MPNELMRQNVGEIPAEPLPFGLESAAVETPTLTAREMEGVNWPEIGCGEATETTWCPPGETKVGSRIDWATVGPVALYYMAECSTIGTTLEEVRRHAETGLRLGRQRGVEQYTMRELLAPNAIDVTPASGPVPIVRTVGILTGELATRYGGVGTLHIPTSVDALMANGHQYADQTHEVTVRRTPIGHRVAIGAGYELNLGPPVDSGGDPVEAPAGQVWLYMTGPVVVRLSNPQTYEPTAGGANWETNNYEVLSEQVAVVQIACVTLAALATYSTDC